MKYLLTALAALIIIATGCKKEKTNIDTRPPKRLSMIIKHYSGFRTENELSYDKDGYLSQQKMSWIYDGARDGSTNVINYKRDANHRILQEINTNSNSGYQVGIYSYNDDGHVARIDYGDGVTTYFYYIFKWQGNQLIATETYTDLDDPVDVTQYKYDSYGNVTEAVQSQRSGTNSYTIKDILYDNTPNPITTIKGQPYNIYSSGLGFQNYSAHNMISATVVQHGTVTLQKYTPEYDLLGMIVRETQNGTPQYREFVYENY